MIKKVINKIKEDYREFVSARKRIEDINSINNQYKEYIQSLENILAMSTARNISIWNASILSERLNLKFSETTKMEKSSVSTLNDIKKGL